MYELLDFRNEIIKIATKYHFAILLCVCVKKYSDNPCVAIIQNIREIKMRKIIFSIITIIMLSSVCLFAQTISSAEEPKTGYMYVSDAPDEDKFEVTRRLSFNLVVESGYLASLDRFNLFEGNDMSFGAGYTQNFTKAPWITFGFLATAFVNQNLLYDNDGVFGGKLTGDLGSLANYIGNVSVGLGLGFNFGYFGLTGFTANVGADTRGRANFRLSKVFWRSENTKHFVVGGFAGEIEFVPYASSDAVASLYNEETGALEVTYDGDYLTKGINLFWLQFGYGYRINSMWSTDVIVYYRSGAYPAAHYNDDGHFYYDTIVNGIVERVYSTMTLPELFLWNTTLRLGWNIRATIDRLNFWAGVRCTIYQIGNPNDNIYHAVFRAGVNYVFDISKL